MWISYTNDHIIYRQKQLYVFLPYLHSFYFFFLPYCISKDFQMMLKRSGERGHPIFVSDLSGKPSSFSPLIVVLAVAH